VFEAAKYIKSLTLPSPLNRVLNTIFLKASLQGKGAEWGKKSPYLCHQIINLASKTKLKGNL
jgi:hypothetical protein